ncbi:uncharacterized protein LOC122255478, partial [Penaeus japonicus]|uniref:uncharacterized protein LOC122255478 n=1 Tax=Penaeus japonicus TaxID=27405 RepID=UPI001C710B3E
YKVVIFVVLQCSCGVTGVFCVDEINIVGETKCVASLACRNVGGRCYDSIFSKYRCDFKNSDLCQGTQCACCISCPDQSNKRCTENYAGSCKRSCDETELEIYGCEAGCKCCGCRISRTCIDAGGYCMLGKKRCNGRVTRACAGKYCYCCIPEPCLQTKCCTFPGGRCDKACNKGEIREEGLCGRDCVCCFPDKCPDSPRCQALDGRCAEGCEADEVALPWLCGGERCTCCVKNNCNQTKCCGLYGGSCGKVCPAGEKAVEDVCEGKCQCCVKEPCEQNKCCSLLGGYCNATCCEGEEAIGGVCNGEHCLCCIPSCSFNGVTYHDGETLTIGCLILICVGDNWQATGYISSDCLVCSIRNDPHFIDFFSWAFDFHGTEEYLLAMSGNGYGVTSDFYQCNGFASCLDTITYIDNEDTVITFDKDDMNTIGVNGDPFPVTEEVRKVESAGNVIHPVLVWKHDNQCIRMIGTRGIALSFCRWALYVWAQDAILGELKGLCLAGPLVKPVGPVRRLPWPRDEIYRWGESLRVRDSTTLSKPPSIPSYCTDAEESLSKECKILLSKASYNKVYAKDDLLQVTTDFCKVDLCAMMQSKATQAEIDDWKATMVEMLETTIEVLVHTLHPTDATTTTTPSTSTTPTSTQTQPRIH